MKNIRIILKEADDIAALAELQAMTAHKTAARAIVVAIRQFPGRVRRLRELEAELASVKEHLADVQGALERAVYGPGGRSQLDDDIKAQVHAGLDAWWPTHWERIKAEALQDFRLTAAEMARGAAGHPPTSTDAPQTRKRRPAKRQPAKRSKPAE